MKKHKNQWQRRLSLTAFVCLLLDLVFPAGLVLAQAAPIGSLRAYDNVVTATTAELRFSFTAAGYFRIDYGVSPGSFTLSSSSVTLTNTSYPYYSITLSGLSPSTPYYYHLATKTLTGTEWVYTGESTFTTSALDTTAPTVSGVYANNVTDTGASINFTINEAGYVKIEYGPNNTFTLSTQENSISAGGASTAGLPGLTAGTTYSYRIVARDSAGNSSTSTSYTFTTTSPPDTTPPTVSGIYANYVTEVSVNINYTLNESGYAKIEYGPNNSFTLSTQEYSVPAGGASTTGIGSLTAGTTYSYRIVARDSAGNSVTSASYTFTTTSTTTSGCTGLSLTLTNNKTTYAPGETVNWTVDCLPTRVTGQFTVQYVKPDGSVATQLTASGVSGWPQSYGLVTSGFTSGTYTLRACLDSSCSPAPAASTTFTITSTTTTQSLPIGWWKFDGNGNNEVAGGPSAAIMGNASFKSSGGALGGYGYIPSSSDYFRIPYSSVFDLPDSFTVEFWFRQRTNQGFNQDLVYKGSSSNNYNFKIFRYLWNQYNNGAVIAGHTALNTGYWTQASNPNEPAHNVWHHVAYTKSSSSQTYYIDGVLIHSKDFTQYTEYSGPAKTPAVDIIIGDTAVDTDIDNLKIYNRALSASEVAQSAGSSTLPPTDTTPPTISGIYTGTITATSTLVYFTSSETGYAKVEYGPNYTYTLSSSEVNVTTGASAATLLYGLTAGTNYSYRIVARDSAGNSATSGSQIFTTLSGSGTTTSSPYGSALDLTGVINLLSKIWGPGSNTMELGGGLNYSTKLGVGWSQQYGGKYVTSYAIWKGVNQNYLTQTVPISVTVTGPAGSIIEAWDLESLTMVAANITSPSSPVTFTAQPNHRYGGFAWYSDNSQKDMAIYASQVPGTPTTPPPTPTTDTTAPVISGVQVTSYAADIAKIWWSTDDQSYGQVEYGESITYGQSTGWTTNLSYSPAMEITGLTSGKIYHYRVRAKNSSGLESTSTTDYTFVAGSGAGPTPTIAFGVDVARLYPQNGSYNIPVATPKIQIEFTKAIDQSSVTNASVYLGFLGATTAASLSGKLDIFSNGFNFILSEPLKAGVSYNFTIRGTVRASSGESLGSDYVLTFTTAKATESAGQGVIKGTVKDSTGAPVAGAYVSLRTSAYYTSYGQSSQTTAYGEYNFANLAVGTHTIEVYPPASGGGLTRPAPVVVTLAAGETMVRDFVLTSGNKYIKGTVKFSDGSPVADAEVSAYRREGNAWVSSGTDANGAFTLAVQAGTWMVSIRPRSVPMPMPMPMPVPMSSMSIYQPVTFPSWIYTGQPQEMYIDESATVKEMYFTVPRQSATTSISGTLQRGDNKPITADSITVRLLGQGGIAISVPVAIGGRFTTPIAPGNYKLYVDVADPDLSSPEIPPISIMPGEQKDIGPIIVGIATVIISGRVTTLEGRGVPRVKVSGWRANSADNAAALTDEQGNYNLKVSPGDWTISIMPSPDQSYSNTAPPQFIRVVRGTKVLLVNFVLAQSDGIVHGMVTDEFGAILSDFYGFVRVGSKNGYHLPGGAPVERGQFTLRLPAGNYILYMELPPNAAYGWPAPVPITVATGESAKVKMKMAASASSAVIGFLVDRAGNKITNVPFKVFATGAGGGWFSALIDMPLGYYKLKVPPGTWYIGYDIKDNSGRYQRPIDAKKKITVAAGEIASLDLQIIEQNGRVNGVVRDNDGNSISNIWVAISGQPFSKFGRETAATQRYLNGATSDEAGQFSLPVPPGVYYVRAFVPPSLGLTNPDEQGVKVGTGEEVSVELVLRSIETTISGQTTIAGVPSWAFVWAWSNKGGYTETYADEKGSFKLKVSSGDIWHVSAMSELKRDAFKASEVAINITRPGTNIPLSLDLAPLGVKLPELVNVSGEADQMTVATNDAGAKLVVPANAASTEGALTVSITPEVITPSQGADRVVGFGYELDVRNAAGQEVNAFNSELTVSIPYDPRELSRLNLRPADLSLRYWDELNSTWQQVMNAIVDEINHVITGSLAHLTRFAIIAATDTTPPSAPTKVTAKVGGDGIVLTWVKPKDKDLQYVKIYRSAKKDVLGEVVANNVAAATYKDSGLKRGATYYYLARAVDAAGNESTNTAAMAVGVKGSGTLGKAAARSATAKVEKLTLKGSITDINLVASTMEIKVDTSSVKELRGKKVVVKFGPTVSFKKDGKKVQASEVKVGNIIDVQATKEAGVITLVSAVVTSVKVKIKAELKVSEFAGQRSKLKVKIIEARGVVAGVGIEKGKEALLNIEGATVNANGKNTPVESLIPQNNVTFEGVVENGAMTVTKITVPPVPKVKVQPAPSGKIGDQAASAAR